MELKLTQVARASLEELRLDYEDFLHPQGTIHLSRVGGECRLGPDWRGLLAVGPAGCGVSGGL